MQISNIQENLTKTELIQRLQQIMQDAARATQDVQAAQGEKRSRIAQELVETSQETENDRVREDSGGQPPEERHRKRKSQAPRDDADKRDPEDHAPPGTEGRIIDVVV